MTDRISTGDDIDSYCTKCRLTLEHIVVAMVGGSVVKVKCKTCGGTHRLKGAPNTTPKSPKKEGGPVYRSSVTVHALWQAAVNAANGTELEYEMSGSYRPGDLIVHSVFGKGVVQKDFYKKCSVLFSDKERTLVTANT